MKLKSALFFFFVFCLFSSQTFSQFKCGSDEARQKLITENPAYKRNLEDMDRDIQRYIDAHPPETSFISGTAATLYYIPCVVHVIYDGVATVPSQYNPSASQITGAIDYINKVYDGSWTGTGGPILGAGDLQIKFVLAAKDPNNVATTGIDRVDGSGLSGYSSGGVNSSLTTGASEISVKNLTRWDPEKYYNIWVVSKIDGCSGYFCGCSCDAGFIAGYAYFPPPNNTTANTRDLDGTIMLASQLVSGQKTLPHELGHMLNLYHPFQGVDASNNCPANATPATQGDMCTDTDPITNPYLAPNTPFQCRTGTNPCTGTAFTDNTEKNYMNYTNCYQLFTNDQKARMQASFATTQRASLATSWANNQGTYPAPFVAPVAAAVTPASGATNDLAGILNISMSGKIVYSLNAFRDGGYLNNAGKWYDAFQLSPSTSYTLIVTALNNTNNSQLGVWIDYDGNGSFNNTNEQVYYQSNIASGGTTTTITANFTTPSTWTAANNFVRMRICHDLSSIYTGVGTRTNTDAASVYGQTEDYPAYLTGGVVPVNLFSFTGKKAADAVTLNWKTSQEINSDSYDIERSVNAAAYELIGNVHATGSATGADYSFRDNNIAKEGNYLYRLKMKDVDGTFTYSNVLSFKVDGAKQLIVTGNPFKDNISMILPYSTGNAFFKLTDAAGRIVYSTGMKLSGASTTTLLLHGNSISRGVYILEAVINGERFTQKVVKE